MRFGVTYLKYNLKWMIGMLLCAGMMAALLIFNQIPEEEVFYGVGVILFVLMLFVVVDITLTYRRCKNLRRISNEITFSLENLETPWNPLEQEYQNLLRVLSEEKNRKENEWQAREQDLAEYYTMWVHQIKTPIAALKLLLEEKNTEGENTEELGELFSIEQYVKMALQYTKLDGETTDFVFQTVPLDTVVRQAVRQYARQFIHKKIRLEYEELGVSVLTDEKWLEFVMEQLLSNAIKYTESGSVTISMEGDCLVIADNGIGIRAEDIPRVMERGYTGYNGHANKRSTGIGLYLCQRILKKLGHSFSIESKEGEGTRVRIGSVTETENLRD